MTTETKHAELKPCPFCGGEASADGHARYSPPLPDTWWDDGSPITEAFFVNCRRCGAVSRSGLVSGYQTQAEAIAAWNARASDARIAELEAEVARLKNQSEWFYHGDDQGSDKCRFSVFEVIDEDVYYDDPRPGKKIVHITTARRCADIWAVVHIFSDAEKDERDDDEPYSVSEYATEEQARAALGEQQP